MVFVGFVVVVVPDDSCGADLVWVGCYVVVAVVEGYYVLSCVVYAVEGCVFLVVDCCSVAVCCGGCCVEPGWCECLYV